MFRRFRPALLATVLLTAPALVMASDVPSDVCGARSAEFLQAMEHGDFVHAGKDFNTQIASALPSAKLKQVWSQILGQFGAYQSQGTSTRQTIAGTSMVVTRLAFANAPLDALVACDADGKINTFRLVPAPPEGAAMSHAVHVDSNGITSRSVQVQSPLGPLPGTLTLPKGDGPFAAAILLAGSGPHDGDETIGPNKPLLDVAKGLAAAGIASLRYDKRTLVYGAKVAGDTTFTIDDEVTEDALSALKLLAHEPHVDASRLFVIGHSLGAMMAPRIGKRDPQLAGLVMMAAPTRSLLDVSADQVRDQGRKHGMTAAQIAANLKAISDEQALLAKADPEHPPAGNFGPAPQSYWLSLYNYHQVDVAKGLTIPMLFVQGGSDFQVSPTLDFAQWEKLMRGHADVTFHLYPGLGHLFMPAGKTGTVADYQVAGHVDPKVIDGIATWIKAQSAHGP